MLKNSIRLIVSPDDEEVAYVYLPDYPSQITAGITKKQVRLSDLIKNYKGPDIYLDFDETGTLIGIEVT